METVAQAGWYPDPSDPYRTRYWDGQRWTEQRGDWSPPAPAAVPSAAPRRRWVLPLVLGLLVVALLAVVGTVAAVTFLGGDDALPDEAAAEALDELLDGVDSSEPFVDLSACPLGDAGDLLDAVAEQVGVPALGGAPDNGTYEGDPHEPGVSCSRFDEDDDVLLEVYAAGKGDGPYEEQLEGVFADLDLRLEATEDHRGGTIQQFCVEDDEGADGCGADWVSDEHDLAVGIYVEGDGDDVASTAVAGVLEDLLPGMVEQLAEGGAELET